MHLLEARQAASDIVDHRGEPVGGEPRGAEPFRQGHHAHRQRQIPDQPRLFPRIQPHPCQLGRAAPDVEQQRPPPGPGQQRRAAFHRQLRLLARRDRRDCKPGLLLHPRQEFGAIGGPPARLGCHRPQPAHRAAFQPLRAYRKCRDGPLHRGGAKPPRIMQPFAQPHPTAEAVHHTKPVGGRGAHQHAAIVGAKIQRRECGRGGTIAPRGGAQGRVRLHRHGLVHHPAIVALVRRSKQASKHALRGFHPPNGNADAWQPQ